MVQDGSLGTPKGGLRAIVCDSCGDRFLHVNSLRNHDCSPQVLLGVAVMVARDRVGVDADS